MGDKQVLWARALLACYKYLEPMCNIIDKQINRVAQRSFYMSTLWAEINSIENVSSSIIDLSQEKISYINLKVLTENVLNLLKKDYAKVLILKYVHKLKVTDICKVLCINERTFYRKSEQAILEFAKKMTKLGYNYEMLEVKYQSLSLISSVIKSVEKHTQLNRNISLDDEEFFKSFFKCLRLNSKFNF